MSLNHISVGTSPLTGEIFLFHFGKDKEVALDKRPAEGEVFCALIDHMLHDMPPSPRGGVSKVVSFGDKKFEIIVRPV